MSRQVFTLPDLGEGLTEAELVRWLVKVGDTMTEEKASQAIHTLFATGFFKDVSMEVEGNVLVVVVEMSVLHPPLGLNIFVLKSLLPEVPLKQIYWGVIPFWMGDFVRLALILAFPAIALAIPAYLIR